MVNPGAFRGSRREFLLGEKAAYAAGLDGGYGADALALIQRRFFKRYPIDLGHNVEPSPEHLASVDDNAPDIEPEEPDPEKLSPEDYEAAKKASDHRKKSIQFRKAQIKRWLAYQYMKDQELDPKESGVNNPYYSLIFAITGKEAGKPRRRTAVNVWRKTKRAAIELQVKKIAEETGVSKDRWATLRDKVARDMFNELPKVEQEQWDQQAKLESDFAMEQWKNTMLGEPPNTNTDYQMSAILKSFRAIQGLVRVAKPFLDFVCKATGWKASIIAGGPEPAHGGKLNVMSIHSGLTPGTVEMTWGRALRERYKKEVVGCFGDFLKMCYTPDECRKRALPGGLGFNPFDDEEYGEEVTEVHPVEPETSASTSPTVVSTSSSASSSQASAMTTSVSTRSCVPTNATAVVPPSAKSTSTAPPAARPPPSFRPSQRAPQFQRIAPARTKPPSLGPAPANHSTQRAPRQDPPVSVAVPPQAPISDVSQPRSLPPAHQPVQKPSQPTGAPRIRSDVLQPVIQPPTRHLPSGRHTTPANVLSTGTDTSRPTTPSPPHRAPASSHPGISSSTPWSSPSPRRVQHTPRAAISRSTPYPSPRRARSSAGSDMSCPPPQPSPRRAQQGVVATTSWPISQPPPRHRPRRPALLSGEPPHASAQERRVNSLQELSGQLPDFCVTPATTVMLDPLQRPESNSGPRDSHIAEARQHTPARSRGPTPVPSPMSSPRFLGEARVTAPLPIRQAIPDPAAVAHRSTPTATRLPTPAPAPPSNPPRILIDSCGSSPSSARPSAYESMPCSEDVDGVGDDPLGGDVYATAVCHSPEPPNASLDHDTTPPSDHSVEMNGALILSSGSRQTGKRKRAIESCDDEPVDPKRGRSRRVGVSASSTDSALLLTTSPTGKLLPPAGSPPWFFDAIAMFQSRDLGASWISLIRSWATFEIKSRFHSSARLKTSDRPSCITEWIRKQRLTSWRPNINDFDAYEAEYHKWWISMQPPWRVSKEGDVDQLSVNGDWGELRKAGMNGIYSILAGLFFWGDALTANTQVLLEKRKKWKKKLDKKGESELERLTDLQCHWAAAVEEFRFVCDNVVPSRTL
ncbi:hypothetical protein CVT26_004469 [Gymnopilus dilepis]|uniref:Uncharacterized protein n=1 Tax=Gymnopilus dilepis TaxID=231916 RepID=A0A409WDY6_9AGAR|nr:hypothetical protein CVT26_004469 [Gymnopilus dilepis]